ncbi:G-protein coupled receptor GRL101-like [Pecten maximus]|uniref:G-protein coupled receptor GRL101-like n=1 Tax=Pecten maximus TaxID=6579 RepID=UPI0014583ECE|nr:G-protein coupled receptor GRL101-like [Pecten maximus]
MEKERKSKGSQPRLKHTQITFVKEGATSTPSSENFRNPHSGRRLEDDCRPGSETNFSGHCTNQPQNGYGSFVTIDKEDNCYRANSTMGGKVQRSPRKDESEVRSIAGGVQGARLADVKLPSGVFQTGSGQKKNRDFNKNTEHFVKFVVDRKYENREKRVKRQVLKECPQRRLRDMENNSCPPETSRQLVKYECCIHCLDSETGGGCEPYDCTAIHACSSVQEPLLDVNKDDSLFNGLTKVNYLNLTYKNITVLPDNVFYGLSDLASCSLSLNRIRVLPHNVFSGLSKLTYLDLSGNIIQDLPHNVFSGLSKLSYLDLSFNTIHNLPHNVFSGLSNLAYLDLSFNTIQDLPHNVFHGLSNLTYLNLSNNNIGDFPHDIFNGLYDLTHLILGDNEIAVLPFDIFNDLSNNALTQLPRLPSNLSYLNIVGNNLRVTEHMFEGLDNLDKLFTDVPFMCCVKPPSVEDNNCRETKNPLWMCIWDPDLCKSEGDAISSCFALIGSTVLRVCLWLIGIFALIGNLIVISYRLFLDRENITKSYSIFTLNLAISDLLMGIYLLIIAVVDVYYNNIYAWNDYDWRNSMLCTMAGVLSNVSSEMSTFLVLLVTIDRLIVIISPLSRLTRWSISWKLTLLVSVSLWIVSITIAVIPIVAMQSYFKGEFYSQSGVCLALPLTGDERPGTDYSFAVFVCLNSIIFAVIFIGQICICKSLRRSGRCITSSQSRQRERTVATTLFFVVMTDFCCWFPIGVMGVVSRYGVKIPDSVYAWVMVFVLPINAAINPFLYTASAIWRKRKQNEPTPVTS